MTLDLPDRLRVRRADGPVIADVVVPPSKSIANRALICAALAEGESKISGIAPGDDTSAMLDCLERLGVVIDVTEHDQRLIGTVTGNAGVLPAGPINLQTRLAGTTSRFITALAALGAGPYVIDGAAPLRARPMAPLHDTLAALGARIEPGEHWGHLPVTVSGPLGGADAVMMPGNVSSQYVSALMMVAPYIRRGMRLGLSTELVSRPYVEITRSIMSAFGVDDVDVSERTFTSVPVDTSAPTTRLNPTPRRPATRSRQRQSQVERSASRASGGALCRETRSSLTSLFRWDVSRPSVPMTWLSCGVATHRCAASISTWLISLTWYRRWRSSPHKQSPRRGSLAWASSVRKRAIASAISLPN